MEWGTCIGSVSQGKWNATPGSEGCENDVETSCSDYDASMPASFDGLKDGVHPSQLKGGCQARKGCTWTPK